MDELSVLGIDFTKDNAIEIRGRALVFAKDVALLAGMQLFDFYH